MKEERSNDAREVAQPVTLFHKRMRGVRSRQAARGVQRGESSVHSA